MERRGNATFGGILLQNNLPTLQIIQFLPLSVSSVLKTLQLMPNVNMAFGKFLPAQARLGSWVFWASGYHGADTLLPHSRKRLRSPIVPVPRGEFDSSKKQGIVECKYSVTRAKSCELKTKAADLLCFV